MSKGNESAFPSVELDDCGQVWAQKFGLAKREYFAAMAMQGLVVNQPDHFSTSENERRARIAVLALQAVEHADALIAELAKEQ